MPQLCLNHVDKDYLLEPDKQVLHAVQEFRKPGAAAGRSLHQRCYRRSDPCKQLRRGKPAYCQFHSANADQRQQRDPQGFPEPVMVSGIRHPTHLLHADDESIIAKVLTFVHQPYVKRRPLCRSCV